MKNADTRLSRYEFLRQRSYPVLWNPYMCDTFMDFESDLAPEDLLRSAELLQKFREVGVELGIKGAGDLTAAEVISGCRGGEPLVMDFIWRGVSHVVRILQIPRSVISHTVMQDLQQELLMQLVTYEPRYCPNVSDDEGEGAATLAGYFFSYPVMRSIDAFKRLLFGGRSASIEKRGAISIEARMREAEENGAGWSLEDMLADIKPGVQGFEMDSSLLGENMLQAVEDCTPKEKDVVVLCLLLLGATDQEVGDATGMTKTSAFLRRHSFEEKFPKLVREFLGRESISGLADSEELAREMCYGRADGRSAVDSRITTAPEVQDIQWDKLDAIWEGLITPGGC